jgi:hypothetical protein
VPERGPEPVPHLVEQRLVLARQERPQTFAIARGGVRQEEAQHEEQERREEQ